MAEKGERRARYAAERERFTFGDNSKGKFLLDAWALLAIATLFVVAPGFAARALDRVTATEPALGAVLVVFHLITIAGGIRLGRGMLRGQGGYRHGLMAFVSCLASALAMITWSGEPRLFLSLAAGLPAVGVLVLSFRKKVKEWGDLAVVAAFALIIGTGFIPSAAVAMILPAAILLMGYSVVAEEGAANYVLIAVLLAAVLFVFPVVIGTIGTAAAVIAVFLVAAWSRWESEYLPRLAITVVSVSFPFWELAMPIALVVLVPFGGLTVSAYGLWPHRTRIVLWYVTLWINVFQWLLWVIQHLRSLAAISSAYAMLPATPKDTLAPGRWEKATDSDRLQRALNRKGHAGRIVRVTISASLVVFRFKPQDHRHGELDQLRKDIEDAGRTAKLFKPGKISVEDSPDRGRGASIMVHRSQMGVIYLRFLMDLTHNLGEAAIPIGLDPFGNVKWVDLSDPNTPHIMMLGTSGSGKSNTLNAILVAFLIRCPNLYIVAIDPKGAEFKLYQDLPNFRFVTDKEEVVPILEKLYAESVRRYKLFNLADVRDIDGWNELARKGKLPAELQHLGELPRILVVFDEFADFVNNAEGRRGFDEGTKKLHRACAMLAQYARASGIHLIVATQNPTADLIPSQMKANLPFVIALRVKKEGQALLGPGAPDATRLFGRGEMYLISIETDRVKGPYMPTQQVKDVVAYLLQRGCPDHVRVTDLGARRALPPAAAE